MMAAMVAAVTRTRFVCELGRTEVCACPRWITGWRSYHPREKRIALAEPGATYCATAYSGKGGLPWNELDASHIRLDSSTVYLYHASSPSSQRSSL